MLVSPHPQVILPKALVLQDECFEKYYWSFLDFTFNYEWTSGIFVPCSYSTAQQSKDLNLGPLGHESSILISELCFAAPLILMVYNIETTSFLCSIYSNKKLTKEITSDVQYLNGNLHV